MLDKTILVIDDSATIRKLADSHLSGAGYHVVLAPTAEDGLRLASERNPDLILLDHQLPGTTGFEVCQNLLLQDHLKQIPVVISSTLRKKAYAEYVELDNVVDMLPKPYTGELLLTTVANAIETAAVVVASQSQGTAVPETIQPVGEASFSGAFTNFSLREIIDFLNNGGKSGILEIETQNSRIRFHLEQGRVQGVFAAGISPEVIQWMVSCLPDSLAQLAPVLKMTIGGRSSQQFSGLVQLLDHKVLDPRLLRKLLRFQAALLTWYALEESKVCFRFDACQDALSLPKDMPLDCSLLALLVEASLYTDLPVDLNSEKQVYSRRAIRGQNLDRAGLSARHLTLMTALTEPKTEHQLVEMLQWETTEVRQVLRGFVAAELIESNELDNRPAFLVFEPQPQRAEQLRALVDNTDGDYKGIVVCDDVRLKHALKQNQPVAVFFSADDGAVLRWIGELSQFVQRAGLSLPLIGFSENEPSVALEKLQVENLIRCEGVFPYPGSSEWIGKTLRELTGRGTQRSNAGSKSNSSNAESTLPTDSSAIAVGVSDSQPITETLEVQS